MLSANEIRGLYAILPTPAKPGAEHILARDTVDLDETARAVEALIADGCDGLIAVGGGSSIDLAKGVAIAATWFVRAILHDACLEPGLLSGMLEATQRRWIVSRLDQFLLGALAARAFVVLEHSPRAATWAPWGLVLSIPLLIGAFRLEGAYYYERGGSFPYAFLSLVTTMMVFLISPVVSR